MWTLFAAPVENGDTEMSTEEPWDQKEAEPNEEEPGGGDRGPVEQATTEETAPEMMEEEEEAPAPKVPPTQPDAPRKEHINVVFIGHVGQCIHLWMRLKSEKEIITLKSLLLSDVEHTEQRVCTNVPMSVSCHVHVHAVCCFLSCPVCTHISVCPQLTVRLHIASSGTDPLTRL